MAKAEDTVLDAKHFTAELKQLKSNLTRSNAIYFKGNDPQNKVLDVRMADVFSTAKRYKQMPVEQISLLLQSKVYEIRMGAVSIMDFQARDKKTSAEQRKKLFDLYINNHDRIDNWDLVDRGAPHIVGGYLSDKPRAVLYLLAKSKNPLARRTSIVATWFFIRQNQTDDTFKIAEILVFDKEEQVNMAVGSWIREAGKRNPDQLIRFLDRYAATMPRVTLRYAVEKLEPERKKKYMELAAEKQAKDNKVKTGAR